MAVAWFIVPMVRRILAARIDEETGDPVPADDRIIRYCQMDDHTGAIQADGGAWAATEVLGHRALVKVRASQATLDTLAGIFRRLPMRHLDTPLSDLPLAVRRAIRDELEAMGYPLAEITDALGAHLGSVTLCQVLAFAARRRRKVRYDAATDSIVDDGPEQPVTPPAAIDTAVGEG